MVSARRSCTNKPDVFCYAYGEYTNTPKWSQWQVSYGMLTMDYFGTTTSWPSHRQSLYITRTVGGCYDLTGNFKRRVAVSRRKTAYCSLQSLPIGGILWYFCGIFAAGQYEWPRTMNDPVITGQMTHFTENWNFSKLVRRLRQKGTR